MRCDELALPAVYLSKAGKALMAFSELYLRFHGLPQTIFFNNFGLFSCVEAMAYAADTENERGCEAGAERWLGLLEGFLRDRGLWFEDFGKELDCGRIYFAVERRFRADMEVNLEEIKVAGRLRSFDFRILHHLLWRLNLLDRGEGGRGMMFDAFEPFEELMEIDDDLKSVEDDSQCCRFNIAAMISRFGIGELGAYCDSICERVSTASAIGGSYGAMLRRYIELVPESIFSGTSCNSRTFDPDNGRGSAEYIVAPGSPW